MSKTLDQLSDEELVRISRTGSISAFEELVTRFERRIYQFIANRIANRQDVEDLTQKTFIQVYRNLERFDDKHKFTTWIFTIARRLTISHFRSLKPRLDEEPERIEFRNPFHAVLEGENRKEFWGALRSLISESQYTAVWLKYQEELSVKEIATTMRTTQSRVKVLLFRARRKLAEQGEEIPEVALPRNGFKLKESRT